MSVFESTRGSFVHRYDVRSDALYYSCDATQLTLTWEKLEKIYPGRGDSLYFKARKGQPVGIWLDPSKMEPFLRQAIAAWGACNHDLAQKAAYEYGLNERSIGWIWLVLSFFFPVLLSVLLLSDGYHMLACTPLLQSPSAKTAPARLLKVKKDRRGEMVWTVEFQTEDGKTIHGIRTSYAGMDEMGRPTGEPSVVYAPSRPSCWDLSTQPLLNQNGAAPDKHSVSKTELQFNILLTLGFGAFFAFLGLLGVGFSLRRIRRVNPFKEVVLAAAQALKPR